MVDVIVAGQAFHWFDARKSKTEFRRILKPGGLVILIWNERKRQPLLKSNMKTLILKYGKDYQKIDHRNISDQDMEKFLPFRSALLKYSIIISPLIMMD